MRKLNGDFMNRIRYQLNEVPSLTAEQEASLKRLALRSEDDIDLSDIPEITQWSDAIHGGLTTR